MIDERARLLDAIELAAAWLDEQVTLKTIGQVVTQYDDKLTNAVYDVWNGHSSAVDLRRAHKAMLKQFAPMIYLEGMHEGGIKEDDIDEKDQADLDEAVNDWLSKQVDFVNAFAKDAEAARRNKDERPKILDRVGMWVDSLRSLGDLGKAYALKNERGQWILGETEQHCDTCKYLAGLKPHRVSWFVERGYIPRQNGSGKLDCGGWKCDCSVVNNNGDQLL